MNKREPVFLDRVDVRGPYPVYIDGYMAVQLLFMPRDITVQEARELVYGDDVFPDKGASSGRA